MRNIDLRKLADEAHLNRFHIRVLVACALIIIFDGYDLAIVGIALPLIMKEYGVNPANAGFMISSSLIGMTLGAIVFGTIADKIGRRRAIAICILLFSVFTAAAGFAKDPISFGIVRFFAGLGIGGVMPSVIALMSEYSPKNLRSTLVSGMFSGYAIGGVVAAISGKGLIESYGWQSVFFAAALPVLLLPIILRALPESMPFLLARGEKDKLKIIAAQIDPSYNPLENDYLLLRETTTVKNAPIKELFSEGRAFSTAMFWIAFFMCLFMVYALNTWLTKLMAGAGFSLGSALTFVLVLNLGAVVGSIGGGWLADRFHIKYVLVAMYALAAVSITLLGVGLPTGVLFVVVGLAGAATIGTQIVANAYCADFYPVTSRSTGIGWALGIGRIGAILAPILIGVLVSMDLPLQKNFLAIAIPGVLGMVAISLVNHTRSQAQLAQDRHSNAPQLPEKA